MGFFDGLTGGKQRDDYAAGHTAFRDQVGRSAKKASKHLAAGRDNALARYEPYTQLGAQGRGDYDLYRKSIGLDGADGYDEAYEVFEADPFRDYRNQNLGNVLRDQFRRYNAAGMADSGVNRLAQARIGGEFAQRDVDDFRNRLMNAGSYGTQLGYGADAAMAGLDYGTGQQLAGIETNAGNALAQSHLGLHYDNAATRGLGANNLMRLIGTGTNALATGYKAGMFG
ncbi:MAG TPA: hypothetical protein DCG72_02120 [Gammaproteobacteria bacterium]|nr:hypothetical protein [Gammaproteobacteria bacterium]